MTTATTTRDTQIAIAYEVLMMDETGKTKKSIAEEFNVSTRSVNRYFEKYEEEALDLVTGDEPQENIELAEAFADKKEETSVETEVTSEVEEPEETQADTTAEEEESEKEEPKAAKTRKPIERDDEGLTANQRSILNTYLKQKASGNMDKVEDRKGKVGRAKKNVKTIRYITMEILEEVAATGNLTKGNKDNIVKEIMEAADTDEKTAKQYFSGHKILFGDYQG